MVRACRQGRTAKGPFSGKCGPAASALASRCFTHAELRGREKPARRPLNLPARSGFGQEPGNLVDAETNEQIALPRAEVAPGPDRDRQDQGLRDGVGRPACGPNPERLG